MSADLHRQIYQSMDARETEDLIAIWQQNDQVEWSEEAFGVVREILQKRGVPLPEQHAPIHEHEQVDEIDTSDLSEEELRIVDDENPPDFYDPFEVLNLGKWLNIAAIASIVIAVFLGLSQFRSYRDVALSYFASVAGREYLALLVAVVLLLVAVGLQVVVTYLPLRVLAQILCILMEMEFNSRKSHEPMR